MRYSRMPKYLISVLNDTFSVEDEEEHADGATATEQAIRGALAMGAEQVLSGQNFFGAHVTVSDGENCERFIVSIGVSPLL